MKEKLSPKKKILEVSSTSEMKNPIPELRLKGEWLQSNGFYEKMQVEIIYGFEYIVIYPYKK
ncbi:MAG: type I toxin-antitoxin system SymE family toxin [bacterium]|nr:type I toxin-antitoxin system SymE family toxin [bacterium]